MTQILSKSPCRDGSGVDVYWHWCPGCSMPHGIHVGPKTHPDQARWTFNGNWEKPTFTPSIRCLGSNNVTTCHYFITDGVQDFCNDSPHEQAGKKVPLMELPKWLTDGDDLSDS